VKIWHNPRCTKSRQGLAYLEEEGVEVDVFQYLKESFSAEQLAAVIKMSDQPLQDFVRTNEAEYKELGLKIADLSLDKFVELAVQYPKILQRPIAIKDGKAVVARPIEKLDKIL
jgi:arsenate reductase